MRIGFATDIHLDQIVDVKGYAKHRGVGEWIAHDMDVLLLGGDLTLGPRLKDHLTAFCEGAGIPVYFVLGNHDFWDAPVADVYAAARSFPGYLDEAGVVELTSRVGLVGRTGWYDTLSGNPFDSAIRVERDWRQCERLVNIWRDTYQLQAECRRWATEETERLRPVLEEAARGYQEVYVVSHFPCFAAAIWNQAGQREERDVGWWPWSINTTMGHTIREIADARPEVDFTLLTGHTHGGGRAQLSANLTCVSGRAQYGNPSLATSWVI